jgi:hypothetical protein
MDSADEEGEDDMYGDEEDGLDDEDSEVSSEEVGSDAEKRVDVKGYDTPENANEYLRYGSEVDTDEDVESGDDEKSYDDSSSDDDKKKKKKK